MPEQQIYSAEMEDSSIVEIVDQDAFTRSPYESNTKKHYQT